MYVYIFFCHIPRVLVHKVMHLSSRAMWECFAFKCSEDGLASPLLWQIVEELLQARVGSFETWGP